MGKSFKKINGEGIPLTMIVFRVFYWFPDTLKLFQIMFNEESKCTEKCSSKGPVLSQFAPI